MKTKNKRTSSIGFKQGLQSKKSKEAVWTLSSKLALAELIEKSLEKNRILNYDRGITNDSDPRFRPDSLRSLGEAAGLSSHVTIQKLTTGSVKTPSKDILGRIAPFLYAPKLFETRLTAIPVDVQLYDRRATLRDLTKIGSGNFPEQRVDGSTSGGGFTDDELEILRSAIGIITRLTLSADNISIEEEGENPIAQQQQLLLNSVSLGFRSDEVHRLLDLIRRIEREVGSEALEQAYARYAEDPSRLRDIMEGRAIPDREGDDFVELANTLQEVTGDSSNYASDYLEQLAFESKEDCAAGSHR